MADPVDEGQLVFTEHVRTLETSSPTLRELLRVHEELCRVLTRELRRRGIWDASPAYLGIFGWHNWLGKSAGEHTELGTGALDELAVECYSFVFVDRLRGLRAQLRNKAHIEGLVALNVKHFIFERQKANDPIGYRTYEVTHLAVEIAVDEEFLVADRKPIRNETQLTTPRSGTASAVDTFDRAAATWVDELMPELVSAGEKGRQRTARVFCEELRRTARQGLMPFQFRQLVDPMKAAARRACAAILSRTTGSEVVEETVEAATEAWDSAELQLIERDQFEHLVTWVTSAINSCELPEKSRVQLLALWNFLHTSAVEEVAKTSHRPRSNRSPEKFDRLPSNRKLASTLGIPRESLPSLLEELRAILRATKEARSRPAAEPATESRFSSQELSHD